MGKQNEPNKAQENQNAKQPNAEPKVNEIDALKAQIAQMQHENLQLQSQLATANSQTEGAKAQIKALQDEVQTAVLNFTNAELEELKVLDPDAFYAKKRELEEKAKKMLDEKLQKAGNEAMAQQLVAYRQVQLAQFRQSHTDFDLTDDFLNNEIPIRIKQELERTGDFAKFLQDAYEWGKTGKTIGVGVSTLNQPDLSRLGGNNDPEKNAQAKDLLQQYSKAYGF